MSTGSTHGTGRVLSDRNPGIAFSWLGSGSPGENIAYVPVFGIMFVPTLVGGMVSPGTGCGPSSLAGVRIGPTGPCWPGRWGPTCGIPLTPPIELVNRIDPP